MVASVRLVSSKIAYGIPQFQSSTSTTSIATTTYEIIRNTTDSGDVRNFGADEAKPVVASSTYPAAATVVRNFDLGDRAFPQITISVLASSNLFHFFIVKHKAANKVVDTTDKKDPFTSSNIVTVVTYNYKRKRLRHRKRRVTTSQSTFDNRRFPFETSTYTILAQSPLSKPIIVRKIVQSKSTTNYIPFERINDRKTPDAVDSLVFKNLAYLKNRSHYIDDRIRDLSKRFNTRFRRQTVSRDSNNVSEFSKILLNSTDINATTARENVIFANNQSGPSMTPYDQPMGTGNKNILIYVYFIVCAGGG